MSQLFTLPFPVKQCNTTLVLTIITTDVLSQVRTYTDNVNCGVLIMYKPFLQAICN